MHAPSRPDWTCQTCRGLWPGPECQSYLDAMFGGSPAVLRAEMGAQAVLAKRDQPDRAAELEARILGWLEPAA